MCKVFMVNGKGGVGKDTFEMMIQKIGTMKNQKIIVSSTIDCVKTFARSFGWNGEKSLKDRKMLCDFKQLLTEWNDIPYKYITKLIKENYEDTTAFFIDCREPAEIQRFVEDWNALTILVQRSTIKTVYGNSADDNVDNYSYDITIDNSRGLDELYQEALIFYETFIDKE